MLYVGLTGGIGSGKSTVADIFKVLGVPVFFADEEAKKIMQQDAGLVARIQKEFGPHTYTNGQLNRKVLAEIVFSDPYKLARLNAIVHPVTIAAAEAWMTVQTTPYVIKEAALMFEAGSSLHLNHIIGVTAPEPMRIQRVMLRDKVTRQQVLDRMNRQINESLKMKLCDFVIVNDEQRLLTEQVIRLHEKLLSFSRRLVG